MDSTKILLAIFRTLKDDDEHTVFYTEKNNKIFLKKEKSTALVRTVEDSVCVSPSLALTVFKKIGEIRSI